MLILEGNGLLNDLTNFYDFLIVFSIAIIVITALNLGVTTEVVSDLTVSQYNDTGLANGTYWYAVVAFDSHGYTYLSNSVSITVEIPSGTGTSSPGFEGIVSIIVLFVSVLFLKKRSEA